PVEQFEETRDHFLFIGVVLARSNARAAAEGIDLVHEDDAGGVLGGARETLAHRLEHVAHVPRGLPQSVAAAFEMDTRLPGHRPRELRFASARGADDQKAAMDIAPVESAGGPGLEILGDADRDV